MKLVSFSFLCLLSLPAWSGSYRKFNGGNLKIPSCATKYVADNCGGPVDPVQASQPDFAIPQRDPKTREPILDPKTGKQLIRVSFNQAALTIPGTVGVNHFRCLAEECCNTLHQEHVNCDDWCKSMGHTSGEPIGNVAPVTPECPTEHKNMRPFLTSYCGCNAQDDASKVVVYLGVVEAPQTVQKNVCTPITFELRNNNDQSVPAGAKLRVWFGTDAQAVANSKPLRQQGQYYGNSNCTLSQPLTFEWAHFQQGQSKLTVWYLDTQEGPRRTRATIPGLETAAVDFEVK
ncbi:hypothetical protein K2X33_03745 [bacterium]|nr:hypothetical protein [bacterium]